MSVDATSGDGKVIGARRNLATNTVNPVIQSGNTITPVKPPFGSITELENSSKSVRALMESVRSAIEDDIIDHTFKTRVVKLRIRAYP